MNMLQLKSSSSETEIQFYDVEDDSFSIAVVAHDHAASRRAHAYTDALGVVRLFEDAARDWKGWEGGKVWESLDGELRLELSADRRGHISLCVQIRCTPGGRDPWQLEAEVTLDAGQLDDIAARAKALWGNGG